MFVRSWMTRTVVTITPDTSIAEAVRIMQEQGLRRLPVVKGGELLGLVTESDILASGGQPGSTLDWDVREQQQKSTVAKIMSTDPVTGHPGMMIEEVAMLMADRQISSLPIVENDQLIGIVTDSDIYHAVNSLMRTGSATARGVIIEIPDEGDIGQILRMITSRDAVLLTFVTKGADDGQRGLHVRLALDGPDAEDAIQCMLQAGYRLVKHL